MTRTTHSRTMASVAIASVLLALAACGDDSSGAAGTAATTGGTGGTAGAASGATAAGTGGAGGVSGSGSAGDAGSGGSGPAGGAGGAAGTGSASRPTFAEAKGWIDDYQAAHPGQDGDITAKSAAELAADPDAQRLAMLCGDDQLPVIPALTWEYGGNDHAWINPDASALVYCVYTPVAPSTDHWSYDAAMDRVTADVYVLFPDDNPCKSETGADQVLKCLGDASNSEILVDTASLNDGMDVGLNLSEASTELKLILPDGTKVHLLENL